jgi:ABC-type dipeptide/oligopeptide/nickel transport system permease component
MPASPFLRFVARRVGALLLLCLGITMVAFALTQLVPSDPVAANLGEQAAGDPEAVAAFEERYGLDDPIPIQYWHYLTNLLQGDLGESLQDHEPVLDNLARYAPATAELAIFSTLIAVPLGVALGVIAAVRRNRFTDHALRVVSLGGISMPTFWIALVALYVFFYKLGWFPGGDRLDPGVLEPPHTTGMYTIDALLAGQWSTAWNALYHLILPALVLAAYNIGLLTRYARSAVLEEIGNDYVRAARAKGLPERLVLVRHVLRAALPSIVTVIGLVFANVLTGTVLVETIFAWPGIGQYAYRSAVTLDLPAIMGVSLFVAFVYVTVNFVVDVLYGVIDPRIRTT